MYLKRSPTPIMDHMNLWVFFLIFCFFVFLLAWRLRQRHGPVAVYSAARGGVQEPSGGLFLAAEPRCRPHAAQLPQQELSGHGSDSWAEGETHMWVCPVTESTSTQLIHKKHLNDSRYWVNDYMEGCIYTCQGLTHLNHICDSLLKLSAVVFPSGKKGPMSVKWVRCQFLITCRFYMHGLTEHGSVKIPVLSLLQSFISQKKIRKKKILQLQTTKASSNKQNNKVSSTYTLHWKTK